MIHPDTLRLNRTLTGLSQRKLSKIAGLSPLGIKRIEDGGNAAELPLAVVARIADAINVTINDLLEKPAAPPSPLDDSRTATQTLNFQQAQLLRLIEAGRLSTRNLTRSQREMTLPSLIRLGLVDVTPSGPACAPAVSHSLALPEAKPDSPAS